MQPVRCTVEVQVPAARAFAAFAALDAARTRIELEHRHLERHGEGSQKYRDDMGSEYGWPYLLGEYRRFADGWSQCSAPRRRTV